MLTGTEFWQLVQHIIPVYVIILAGYALSRLNIIQPVHIPGISRWVSLIGVPAYVLDLLIFNDLYEVTLRLVGADVLQKLLALVMGCLWWKFAELGSIDYVIDFFMLTTLPNTVLLGDALLVPLYGDAIHGNVVTIICLQSIVWYNLCIALYELRSVLLDMKFTPQQQTSLQPVVDDPESPCIPISKIVVETASPGLALSRSHKGYQTTHLSVSDTPIQRSSSPPADVPFNKVTLKTGEPAVCQADEDLKLDSWQDSQDLCTSSADKGPHIHLDFVEDSSITNEPDPDGRAVFLLGRVNLLEPHGVHNSEAVKSGGLIFASKVAVAVLGRVMYAPLTHASIVGSVYSLLAFRYHWELPYPIQSSIQLISKGAVGIALFLIGTTWAESGRMISCGFKTMTYGMILRFLVGPLLMTITSLALRLRGTNFRFAVLQAVIPQGAISFTLAKEFNLHVDQFATAVIFQLLVFLPIAVAFYVVLDVV